MPNSLRSKLSKLRYKGEITQEEYSELIKKLDGHDKQLLEDLNKFLVEEKGEYVGSDIEVFLAIRKEQNNGIN